MPAEVELPVHPVTGQRAIGVLPSGRVVWPIRGGSGDDEPGEPDAGDGDAGDGADGGDGDLGDAGKSALAKERKARRDAEKRSKALEAQLAERDAKAGDGKKGDAGDDGKPDAAQIRRDAETAATVKANARILAAEVRAAAAGKLADPSDAARYLDLAEFEVGDDGTVDADAITEAISDLIKSKPYLAAKASGFQGSGDGGARGSSRRQLTRADLKDMSAKQINKAREDGRLDKLLGGS
jgi:hypothetical protein